MHQHLSHQIPRLFCVFSYLTTRGDSSTQNCLMTPHSICLWVYLAIREAHKNGPIIGTFSALDFNSRSKMNWKIKFQLRHSVWKLKKKSHSSLRAKRATFTCWQKLVENAKSEIFLGDFQTMCTRLFWYQMLCLSLLHRFLLLSHKWTTWYLPMNHFPYFYGGLFWACASCFVCLCRIHFL